MPITYSNPPIYFTSSLDYLQYLIQCKCYINSCEYLVLLFGNFWNFLRNIFDPQLVECMENPQIWRANSTLYMSNFLLAQKKNSFFM